MFMTLMFVMGSTHLMRAACFHASNLTTHLTIEPRIYFLFGQQETFYPLSTTAGVVVYQRSNQYR